MPLRLLRERKPFQVSLTGFLILSTSDSVRLHSTGISLTVVIPSAFVSLSSSSLSLLSPRSRLRIACAGAWHNLLLWLVLAFVSWTHFEQLVWHMAGWKDVSDHGRSVIEVDFVSLSVWWYLKNANSYSRTLRSFTICPPPLLLQDWMTFNLAQIKDHRWFLDTIRRILGLGICHYRLRRVKSPILWGGAFLLSGINVRHRKSLFLFLTL